MEIESGKLFIGGISWETNEDRLREYFRSFGEVVEAVIIKDRTTGRARGFGFVVFADPAIADQVAKEKHVIDGRTVEAKKAVPRDSQNTLNRNNNSSAHSSPGPVRTKKIFVGGLASTVTESGFKKYFDQFGTIVDVVVMYDHKTQRPRGFGFITYDSEEAVDRVLIRTFHELNGKMVEVKRAVPKELSPGLTRSPSVESRYGLNRINSFVDVYTQGYSPNSMVGHGTRLDGRLSPFTAGQSGYPPFSPSNYGIASNLDSGLGLNDRRAANSDSNISFLNGLNSFYSGNSNSYGSPIGYGVAGGGTGSRMDTTHRSIWGNGSLNFDGNSTSEDFVASGTGTIGSFSSLGNVEGIWGSSLISGQDRVNGSFSSGQKAYSSGENSFSRVAGFGINSGNSVGSTALYNRRNDIYDGAFEKLHGDALLYEEASGLPYSLRNSSSGVITDDPVGFVGGFSVSNGADRGIAA